GRRPELAGAAGYRLEREDLAVEHHAVRRLAPGDATVVAAESATPGAGEGPVRIGGVDQQARDVDQSRLRGGGLGPGKAVVVGAPDAGARRCEQAAGDAGNVGERVDLIPVRQPLTAQGPGRAEVVRERDEAAPPDPP